MNCPNAMAENGEFGPVIACKLLIGRHQGELCINNNIRVTCPVHFGLDEVNLSVEMDT
jgi:hypothetical protein